MQTRIQLYLLMSATNDATRNHETLGFTEAKGLMQLLLSRQCGVSYKQ